MKIRSIFVIVLGLIMLVMLTPAWAGGGGGTPALIKEQHIYGDLGGEWWEWAFDNGFAMFDDGEVDCSLGQSGKVWFLAGTFGLPFAERSCTIPRKKSLFIPLVNQLIFYEAGVDDEEFDLTLDEKRIFLDGQVGGGSLSEPEAVAALAALIGAESTVACDLHATLDGEPLVFTTPIVRGQSGPFTITTDNEALADGFYVLLAPLDAGSHVLEFGGALCIGDGTRIFETAAIYTLDVEGRRRR
jgi:hypothetical protein